MLRPDFTVIGGPNGSGKSTLIDLLGVLGITQDNYHNADDIARSGQTAGEAQAVVRNARERAIAEKRSFTYETVMSHPSHVEAMQRARDAGFFVRLIFVTTDDVEINVARVANRVRLGGHDVPAGKIRARYARIMHETLLPALGVCDEAMIFDNTHDGSAQALPVAHVIGFYVRRYPTPSLIWPDRNLWPRLEASGRFDIVPVQP